MPRPVPRHSEGSGWGKHLLRPQGLVGEPIPEGQVVGTWNTSILGLFWPLGLKKKV